MPDWLTSSITKLTKVGMVAVPVVLIAFLTTPEVQKLAPPKVRWFIDKLGPVAEEAATDQRHPVVVNNDAEAPRRNNDYQLNQGKALRKFALGTSALLALLHFGELGSHPKNRSPLKNPSHKLPLAETDYKRTGWYPPQEEKKAVDEDAEDEDDDDEGKEEE